MERKRRGAAYRAVVSALLVELRNTGVCRHVAAAAIVASAGPDFVLSIEVLLLKDDLGGDGDAVAALWAAALDAVRQDRGGLSELCWAFVGKHQCHGRQKQFAACRKGILLLRWACTLSVDAPRRLAMVDDVAALMLAARVAQPLSEILEDLALPPDALERLREGLSLGAAQSPSGGAPAAGEAVAPAADALPAFELAEALPLLLVLVSVSVLVLALVY